MLEYCGATMVASDPQQQCFNTEFTQVIFSFGTAPE
jgi:hypothetical protein